LHRTPRSILFPYTTLFRSIVDSLCIHLSNTSCLSLACLGKNPKNTNLYDGSPLVINAVIAAFGPGIVSTRNPASLTWFTSSYPGSLIQGQPASETKAICVQYSI